MIQMNKTKVFSFIFWLCCFFSLTSHIVAEEDSHNEENSERPLILEKLAQQENRPGYTINFSNVSIQEYLKFISKIADLNFVFEPNDLNFNVTILSEEPTDLTNILAALVQELRIHGFSLLDDGINLIIHRAEGVNQISTVVSEELPYQGEEPPVLVTRLFRIKTANPASLATLIKPMLSQTALVEVSEETRHLIITDTTLNVDKIADLLVTLDAPKSALDVDSFSIKNNNADNLVALAQQILMPISEGNPLILVPQEETRTIFIVSTPFLTEKALNILADLDGRPITPKKTITGENVFLYQLKYTSAQTIKSTLEEIANNLESQGYAPDGFLETIETAKYIKETHSLVFTGTAESLAKVKQLLEEIDLSGRPNPESENSRFYIYKAQTKSADEIASTLRNIANNFISSGLADQNLIRTLQNLKVEEQTNSIVFTGDAQSIEEIKGLLKNIDIESTNERIAKSTKFYIYKIQYAHEEQIAQALNTLADKLEDSPYPDKALISAIDSMKWIKETNSLIFSGTDQALEKLEGILKAFDVPPENSKAVSSNEFYMYSPKYLSESQLLESIKTLAKNLSESGLSNPALIATLESAKWVSASNSIVFTGDQNSLNRVKSLVASLDVREGAAPKKQSTLVYNSKHAPIDVLEKMLQNLAENLSKDDPEKEVIDNMHVAENSNSLVFKGPVDTLNVIKEFLESVDTPAATSQRISTYVYKAKFVSVDVLEKMLDNLADKLPEDSKEKQVINNMQIATDSNSLIFKGQIKTLDNIKDFLETIDTSAQAQSLQSEKNSYVIYKLKYASGSEIIKDLDNLAKKLKSSDLGANESLVRSIQSIEWLKGTNSLYITGTPEDIVKIKDLIQRFDQEHPSAEPASSYYIYKPRTLSAEELQHQLSSIAEGLESSGLADAELLNTITTAKYVPANNTLVFSGTKKSIESVKELIATLEEQAPTEAPIQVFGKRTFFVYKLKYVPAQQLLMNLKNISSELKHGQADDEDLINTINSGRYIPETNSIIFTGPADALQRVQQLIEKFDTEALAPKQYARQPEGYIVYQPKHVPAQQLINILREFEQHLMQSGIQEPELFDTINNLKYLDKTSSIIITGTQSSSEKVEELLKRFDVPGQAGSQEPAIETIDDVSFLIYKLKYHQGSEIEDALKKIGADLGKTKNGDKNKSLLDAIESVQWVHVTNSLIGTGSPQSLSKLKNLITNIDVPLQQIFIEILVIETDLSNALNFGLRWGTQGKYRNKLGYSTGAFPKFGDSTSTTNDPLSSFTDSLEAITATNTPKGGTFTQGFNLGVIGDLIYHKGKSYTALGSLMDAVRQDGSSTIVLSQKIITQNNKPTSLFSGDNLPFTGSTVQNAGNNATVFTSNLEYKDVGVTLNITPRIGDDGLVSMNIDQEISEELSSDPSSGSADPNGGGGSISNPSVNGISTSKTTMQTQATVPDQHFLVLSGIVRNTKSKQRSSIPCLGGLPIIGAAFQFTETQIQKRSVLVFVKPQIIQDFKQYSEITEDVEDIGRKEGVPEDFDEAIELGKSPNDA